MTGKSLKLILVFAALGVAVLLQRRSLSLLRAENSALREQTALLDGAAADNDQLAQKITRQNVEEETLRNRVAELETELQALHSQLAPSTATVHQIAKATPVPPGPSSQILPPLQMQRRPPPADRVYHVLPDVRAKLVTLSDADCGPWRSYFYLDDLSFATGLSDQLLLSEPDWSISQPLPVTFAEAEQVAREQLRALVRDEPTWEVSEITLRRTVPRGVQKWEYVITLEAPSSPSSVPDSFRSHVSLGRQAGTFGLSPMQ